MEKCGNLLFSDAAADDDDDDGEILWIHHSFPPHPYIFSFRDLEQTKRLRLPLVGILGFCSNI